MVLPIILGALALGAGGFGVTKGLEGADALSKAQGKIKRAQEKYERGKRKLDSRVGYVNDEASKYGGLQQEIKEDVFVRVAALIVEIGRKAKVDLYEILEGIEVKIPSVNAGGSHEVKAENVLNGLLTAAGASAVASAATTGAVTMFATAGTGAAISGLSGAAANSALLAALGGGTLAAGGGGMALGSLVLGGVTFAPILAVGGLAVAAEGEKAITKATEFECEADKALAEMELREKVLEGIVRRLEELSGLLYNLREHAVEQLSQLEEIVAANLFDHTLDEHMEQLRALLLIISSIAQIMKTPILGEDGNINPEIDVVITNARNQR